MDESGPKTYSVSFRLQRTTTDAAFVSVPISADMMIAQADGCGRLDVPKLAARAIEMGRSVETQWSLESQDVQLHPLQMAPPGPEESQS